MVAESPFGKETVLAGLLEHEINVLGNVPHAQQAFADLHVSGGDHLYLPTVVPLFLAQVMLFSFVCLVVTSAWQHLTIHT